MADFAAPFRRDLREFPADIVIAAAKRHLLDLRQLCQTVPDRDQAIADIEAFLRENPDG